MLEEKERDVIVTVQKLVMVSLVEVFKDIAPGYRIREWGDKAKALEVRGPPCPVRNVALVW